MRGSHLLIKILKEHNWQSTKELITTFHWALTLQSIERYQSRPLEWLLWAELFLDHQGYLLCFFLLAVNKMYSVIKLTVKWMSQYKHASSQTCIFVLSDSLYIYVSH